MKKNEYVAPEMGIVKINEECLILCWSGDEPPQIPGGGDENVFD